MSLQVKHCYIIPDKMSQLKKCASFFWWI